jgi:hypothetical protein
VVPPVKLVDVYELLCKVRQPEHEKLIEIYLNALSEPARNLIRNIFRQLTERLELKIVLKTLFRTQYNKLVRNLVGHLSRSLVTNL